MSALHQQALRYQRNAPRAAGGIAHSSRSGWHHGTRASPHKHRMAASI